ncbi:MAG: ATP-dependent helicase Lhr and Lhr-like helicase [Gammaproteobacteria bacterium]|nr:ATP-dependent helicase Lhr and Lhr-like helicase [Gammaproteobacteria bacterium]
MTVLSAFHPAVANWFNRTFDAATPPQEQAWPAIQAQQHVLIAAPTGSGKTLAAFLAAIDRLVRDGLEHGLSDETHIVYVSPLKALSNDIRRNLEAPLAGIREELQALGLPDVEIRTFVRTGDTPQSERNSMRKRPPHIVVTTPESLYILLGSESGRKMLGSTRTVIVDEIHAMVGSKRGLHLAVSLERLEALTGKHLNRVGLSATQKPIEEVARFLVGTRNVRPDGQADCTIIDTGYVRDRDLAIEVPGAPLEAVMSGDVWTEVYDRLAELVSEHRTTLVFVNTRRHAERVARHLSERIGEAHVTAHHGSMAKELRFDAESRLKRGDLKALVATASLELGIDIGDVDLVCQLGSPRSIAAFLQRVGRSGHSVGGTPKGRLFPLSRDDLAECAALLDAVRRRELDRLRMPEKPLDLLAQQIVAEVAAREWHADELFEMLRGAYPYRNLTLEEFDEVVQMLAEGYSTRRGRHGALIYHDAVNHIVRPRPSARLTAITSGGTIPDNADYQVLLEPQATFVGTVNEDFAVESLQGDIFQLGNVSYRILRVERGQVRVADAQGEPPTIPFWLGEAPGRSDELSYAVSRLRTEIEQRLTSGQDNVRLEPAIQWLADSVGVSGPAAVQLVNYLAAARTALGTLPTQQTLIFERFFDEAGGMQLVIHSPFGSRLNRAWGLALRKRFCRSFNFELQAAATEDTIILSLTTAHSFELADVARYLHSNTVRPLLVQALCAAPMFTARWRWSATIALALPRFRGGKKVAAPLARMAAEDLLTSIFPDQVACAENLPGQLEIPDHPLIRQTIHDCLEEAMDIEGFEQLLRNLEAGKIQVIARDVVEPSPLALEVLSARPYAFLDDAPLEERRTQAVMSRRWLDPQTASDIGKLDAEAIQRVRDEAWPDAANADELHDAMLWLTFLTEEEVARQPGWQELIDALAGQKRITQVATRALGAAGSSGTAARADAASVAGGGRATRGSADAANVAGDARAARDAANAHALWVTAERVPVFLAVFPNARLHPAIEVPAAYDKPWSKDDALVEIVRGRLEGLGPVTASVIAASLDVPQADVDIALAVLQAEGFAMRGQFTGSANAVDEWCERRLLARIHRYTVKRLRAEIEPIESRDFLRFLFEWQRVTPEGRMEGPDAVGAVLGQLEGFEAPASAWETEILPSRITEYEPAWLDEQCLAGRFVWTRLAHRSPSTRKGDGERGAAPVRSTPIALLARRNIKVWSSLSGPPDTSGLSVKARMVADYIQTHGASFFDEISDAAGLLPSQAEEALAELVALGIVNSDSFGGLRALLVPADRRRPAAGGRRRRRIALFGMDAAGRWALIRRQPLESSARPTSQGTAAAAERDAATTAARLNARIQDDETIEQVARTLLRRWGVVFWRLLAREADWLPPWRELLMCFRRLEARGEIRGGRFVAGFTGEQYAAPEAIGLLRDMRHKPHSQSYVSLSGADPLNLVGIVTPGTRLPALSSNRLLYRDGVPIALLAGGEVRFLEQLEPKEQWEAQNLLLRRHVPAVLADFV